MLHLLAHSNYSELEFHPRETEKLLAKSQVNSRCHCLNSTTENLTRSKTRENSGVLRVFRGSAGLRVNCSSFSGGTCLIKKYLGKKKKTLCMSYIKNRLNMH